MSELPQRPAEHTPPPPPPVEPPPDEGPRIDPLIVETVEMTDDSVPGIVLDAGTMAEDSESAPDTPKTESDPAPAEEPISGQADPRLINTEERNADSARESAARLDDIL